MKKSDIIKILSWLGASYSAKFKYPRETDAETALLERSWLILLQDFSYQEACVAIKVFMVTSPTWPPTPGEIIQEIEKLINRSPEDNITGAEAWRLVLEAISKFGFYRGGEAVRQLPEPVRYALDCIGGFDRVALSDEGDTYLSHQFIKIFNDFIARRRKERLLPPSLGREIEALHSGRSSPALKEPDAENDKLYLAQ